jgi:hypothetical protein
MAAVEEKKDERKEAKDKGPVPHLVVRRKEGWQFYSAAPVAPVTELVPCQENRVVFSADGRLCAHVAVCATHLAELYVHKGSQNVSCVDFFSSQEGRVCVYDAITFKLRTELVRDNVTSCFFSPRGSFLVTWEPKTPDEHNMLIWGVTDMSLRLGLHQKDFYPNNAHRFVALAWHVLPFHVFTVLFLVCSFLCSDFTALLSSGMPTNLSWHI